MLGMMGNPKKVATLIIAGMSKDKDGKDKGEYNKKLEGTEKSDDDFSTIADEMMNALQEGDKSRLASCLKSMFYNMESRLENKGEEVSPEEEM